MFECKFTPHSNEEWLINIASIEEGKSYIYTNTARLRHKLREIIEIKSINHHFQLAPRLWLRKELMRELSSKPPYKLNAEIIQSRSKVP